MAGKEKVDIKRSDQFQEVDDELTRVMAELDFTIERVTAIFDGAVDENNPAPANAPEESPADTKVAEDSPAAVDAAGDGVALPAQYEATTQTDAD